MSSLQANAFGGLNLIGNGQVIDSFPTRHVEELLGYLLLNRNKPVDRDFLIELLWPNENPEDMRRRLSTVLWRLRRVFRQMGFDAESFLRSTQELISFHPTEELHFDVFNFEQHLNAARSENADATKIIELKKAVDLYKGELYEGIFSDWCLIERERLALSYLQTLIELMNCYFRQNDFAKAIEIGQRITKIDPLREEAHRTLILCYGRLGNRAAAAVQFQLCADHLMTELEVLPMPDTVMAFKQIMNMSVSNIPDSSNPELLKQAHRAHAEFRRASNKLNKILYEIENSKFDTVFQ